MFEKRLEEISKKLNSGKEKGFFVLTHKKHRREIYFQNNKRAISFIKNKFYSEKKSVISSLFYLFTYSLIKAGFLQPFLKKIRLSSNFGQVIFVADQIKGFDLEKKEVISFPLEEKNNRTFIKLKKIINEIAKKGFASKLIKINEKISYVREDLLKEYGGGNEIELFKRLYLFYKSQGIKEISSKEYVKSLLKKMKEKGIKNDFLENILKKLLILNKKILITTLHGDFAKENILINEKSLPVFIDWHFYKGLIISDLVNFFRGEKDLLKNKKFLEILKEVFPQEVQENIGLYIVLNEISKILKDGEVNELSMERIKKDHHRFFLLNTNPPK